MQVVHARCAGLDVHKKSVYVCAICCGRDGQKQQRVRKFGTMTTDLLQLADWLREQEVTHVAMEATGVYWRPVWAVLQGHFELLLVNPHHIKAIPGRKTDTKIASGSLIFCNTDWSAAALYPLPTFRICAI